MNTPENNHFVEDKDSLKLATSTRKTLIDTKERMGMILDSMPVGLLIHQQQGILYANNIACSILNQPQDMLIGKHFLDFVEGPANDHLPSFFQKTFGSESLQQADGVNIDDAQGNTRFYRATGSLLPWRGTPVSQIVLQDVTLQVEKQLQLENLLLTDPLTGAQNRRSFIRYAEQLQENNQGKSCGIIFIDVDKFKNINDKFGHESGDVALCKIVLRTEYMIARRGFSLNSQHPTAMLARMGGEEFAVIVPDATLEQVAKLAEEIRREIAIQPVKTERESFSLSVSVGVACGDLSNPGIDALLREADVALYVAKSSGRNRVVTASDKLGAESMPATNLISRKSKRVL